MTAGMPAERVAEILLRAGYRRIDPPLRIAGIEFDIAAAFVGVGHSADLVVVADMAAHGERKVVQQIEGIARALDVMRSHRPLTTVIIGPRPVGKTLETLSQVGRILPVFPRQERRETHSSRRPGSGQSWSLDCAHQRKSGTSSDAFLL